MRPPVPPQLKLLLIQVRANARLQAGLALIGLLLIGWVFLVLGDWRDAQLAKLEQGHQRLAQVRQLAGEQVWLQRAEDARRLADLLDAEIPPAQSPGLAQAAFQSWLQPFTLGNATPLRLEVQTPTYLDAPADVVRVSAEIGGGMDPRRVWEMIHRIESSTSLVTIPLLTVRSDGANKTFSLSVQGYYRLPAPRPQDTP